MLVPTGRMTAALTLLLFPLTTAWAGLFDDGCAEVGCCDVLCDDALCGDVGCDGGFADFGFLSGCDTDCRCPTPCGAPAHVGAVHDLFESLDVLGILPETFFRTDHCFDGFIQPITNPVYFTDPRSISRVRGLFISQGLPDGSVLQGGDFQVYALQISAAINERWSIIAEKDGYIDLNSGLLDTGGWANLEAGVKYVVHRDVKNQELFTVGLLYEMPSGEADVFERPSNGVWNFFGSYGKEIACGSHFLGVLGYRQPDNGDTDTSAVYYSAHVDYEVLDGIFGVVEFNGRTYTDSADEFPLPVEGFDLLNLGAAGVAGSTTVTMGVGGAYKPNPWYELSAAWEFPINSNEDLFENRVTAMLSLFF
ncbi:MAG: hypothetical protein AAF532_00300 [Planctomycetota bacterium]